MNVKNNETPMKNANYILYLSVFALFLFTDQRLLALKVHAINQTNIPSITDKKTPEPTSQKIKNKIEDMNKRLKISIAAKQFQSPEQISAYGLALAIL